MIGLVRRRDDLLRFVLAGLLLAVTGACGDAATPQDLAKAPADLQVTPDDLTATARDLAGSIADLAGTADLACAPRPDMCGDTQSDPNNCGACGVACCLGSYCANGQCVTGCGSGITLCPLTNPTDSCGRPCKGGICVDTRTDSNHCGGCYKPCATGQVCVSGMCQ